MSRPPEHLCSFCEFPATTVCGGCKVTHYCGPKCQKEEWPIHKSHCKIFKKYPPPADFFPTLNKHSLLNLVPLHHSRPVYPTPWAIARTHGQFDTLPRTKEALDESCTFRAGRAMQVRGMEGMKEWGVMATKRGDELHERAKKEEDRRKRDVNRFEGLSEVLAGMKVLDAYRMYCYEQIREYPTKEILKPVYTPSEHSFQEYFLQPLLLLPPSKLTTFLPPTLAIRTKESFLTFIQTAIAAFPTASISAPISEAEYQSITKWGEEDHLRTICGAVRDAILKSKELEWIIYWEGGRIVSFGANGREEFRYGGYGE